MLWNCPTSFLENLKKLESSYDILFRTRMDRQNVCDLWGEFEPHGARRRLKYI